jgi:hypothetical protein
MEDEHAAEEADEQRWSMHRALRLWGWAEAPNIEEFVKSERKDVIPLTSKKIPRSLGRSVNP